MHVCTALIRCSIEVLLLVTCVCLHIHPLATTHHHTHAVIVKAGSRCELSYPSGVTHVLSRMAGNSTEQFKDREHILNTMNTYGGTLDCQMFRWVDCP